MRSASFLPQDLLEKRTGRPPRNIEKYVIAHKEITRRASRRRMSAGRRADLVKKGQ